MPYFGLPSPSNWKRQTQEPWPARLYVKSRAMERAHCSLTAWWLLPNAEKNENLRNCIIDETLDVRLLISRRGRYVYASAPFLRFQDDAVSEFYEESVGYLYALFAKYTPYIDTSSVVTNGLDKTVKLHLDRAVYISNAIHQLTVHVCTAWAAEYESSSSTRSVTNSLESSPNSNNSPRSDTLEPLVPTAVFTWSNESIWWSQQSHQGSHAFARSGKVKLATRAELKHRLATRNDRKAPACGER